MRRVILNLLRCPRCRRGALVPETDTADLIFGPLHCAECHASFPVAEGVADLSTEVAPPTGLRRGLDSPWVARSYERYLRPALTLAMAQRKVDPESEFLLYRTLLGSPRGPVLDLACGTALFSRRLARDLDGPPVVGLDGSRPMIEEAMAQAREAGVRVDFLRAQAPSLPFLDASLGAVLHAGGRHLMTGPDGLFAEVARVLRPGGAYVGTTFLPPRLGTGWAQRKVGLHPGSEEALRASLEKAGLVRYERMRLPPFLLIKAEKPVARS